MAANLAAILFLPFENRTGHFLTSLDRFGMNSPIFECLTLALDQIHGSVFGGSLYGLLYHSKARQICPGFQRPLKIKAIPL
jgi:hypothetical protein